ncbi:hypothetical protein GCM10022402_08990 [Salinactinospora qingdaonensis]|uniref:Uncharacterized protein n=1 Tax=Salinactinospora qingdaonensis TaxID=702744 RepID=A0ABP7F330_9ACTN
MPNRDLACAMASEATLLGGAITSELLGGAITADPAMAGPGARSPIVAVAAIADRVAAIRRR